MARVAQDCGRPLSFSLHPSFGPLLDLPLAEKVAALRDLALKARLLVDAPEDTNRSRSRPCSSAAMPTRWALRRITSPTRRCGSTAGGRRLRQLADGYAATIVSGIVTYENGAHTGALPGTLVRCGAA